MRPAVLSLALTAVAAAAAAGPIQLVEGIVVRVNERILTISDMHERALEKEAETGQPVTPDEYPSLVQDASDELCLLERATELKVEVSPEEVDGALKDMREQNHIESDEAFDRMLKSMGLSLNKLRERIKDTLTVRRVLAQEVGNLPITDEELKQRYEAEKGKLRKPEEVDLEHIVFPVRPDRSDLSSRLEEARRLVAAARSGGDFAALVKDQVSLGDASGGDLGIIAVPDLKEEVRKAEEGLKEGEISDPFVSSAGVHVVQLIKRIPPSVPPFKDVEKQLREAELAVRYSSRLRSVVDNLKKRYVVETHPDLMAEASR
jgi:peptidyl-prolyl cis-trans isomerase SurA